MGKKKSPWVSVDDGVPTGVDLILAGRLGVSAVMAVAHVEEDEEGNEVSMVYRADNGKLYDQNIVNATTHYMVCPTFDGKGGL